MSDSMQEQKLNLGTHVAAQYPAESFTRSEAAILQRYFTNLDQPVFAIVNLPEVVKGALFARYSRSPKSLRRLFLDEFADNAPNPEDTRSGEEGEQEASLVGVERAERLYERVFVEFGDDSVAQLGGVHLACEQASNLLTKVLERGRLMAYLEQSTRYIAYNARLPTGRYRYYRGPEILSSPLGARYVGDMDQMFDSYSSLLEKLLGYLPARHPKDPGDSDFVHRQALRAKALDLARGLLPAATLSSVGIYGTGQAFESLLIRMRSHPLAEARSYAELMLTELRKVIPSYLRRVDDPTRGGSQSRYLEQTRESTLQVAKETLSSLRDLGGRSLRSTSRTSEVAKSWVDESIAAVASEVGAHVSLTDFDPQGENKVIAAMLYAASNLSDAALLAAVEEMSDEERAEVVRAYVGERRNRREKPGRAFERTSYRFDIVSDYGAFRDLQRHRMLTIEWQSLGTWLGYVVPDEVVEAGLERGYRHCLEISGALYDDMLKEIPGEAQYAVSFAYHLRYVMQMSAREAMHLIELRSSPQGHSSYRWLVQQMHELIRTKAGHRHIAAAMSFVSTEDVSLERLSSERRSETRRAALKQPGHE